MFFFHGTQCVVGEFVLTQNGALLTDDLAADSLDSVELVMAIENRFAIDIPDEDAEEIRSVRELIQYVTLALAIKDTTHDTTRGAPVSTRRH